MAKHDDLICTQVFVGLIGICGIVAISKVEFQFLDEQAEFLGRNSDNWEFVIDLNVLLCSILLVLASGGTLIMEIVMLVISLVMKSNKVAVVPVIVVSYIVIQLDMAMMADKIKG